MDKLFLKGTDGKTCVLPSDILFYKPLVKGIDYWTPADQESIVQQVITALGTPVFGRVDADNNIILTGELTDGTYTLKYEDAEGNVTVIGTLEQGASYKNLADPTSADWLTNYRLNTSGEVTATTPALTTNYIPVKMGDIVRVRYMNVYHQGPATGNATSHFYDANKNRIASVVPASANVSHIIPDADGLGATFDMTKASEKFTIVSGSVSDIQYVRLVGKLYDGYTADDIIITVNQEITGGNGDAGATYTNQIPISIDSDGSVYNGIGYKTKTRLNSSGGTADIHDMSASNPVFLTGFIPVKAGDVIRMKNCYADVDGVGSSTDTQSYYGSEPGNLRFWTYHDTFGCANQIAWGDLLTSSYVTATADSNGHVTEFIYNATAPYIRLCLGGDPETAIVTINEEIA